MKNYVFATESRNSRAFVWKVFLLLADGSESNDYKISHQNPLSQIARRLAYGSQETFYRVSGSVKLYVLLVFIDGAREH